jgi:EEF1A N-terminal glycine/lysine methyltransferase
VSTDYPDNDLMDNIKYNVENCGIDSRIKDHIVVDGYLWGSNADALLSNLENHEKFDVIILSDTVSHPKST